MSATGSDAFGRCVYCGSLTDSVGCVNISCAARTGMRATEADSSVAIDCPDAGAEGARTVLRATPPPERNHATGCAFAGPVLGFQSCGCNAPAVGAGAEPVAPSSLIGACPVCQHALDQCSHCDVPAVGAEAEPVAWGIWNAKRGAVVQTWCGVGAERDARRVARIVSESAWGKCEPVPLYRAPRVPEVMEAETLLAWLYRERAEAVEMRNGVPVYPERYLMLDAAIRALSRHPARVTEAMVDSLHAAVKLLNEAEDELAEGEGGHEILGAELGMLRIRLEAHLTAARTGGAR